MNKQLKARWKNALNIAARINKLIDDGFMVFDSDGEIVSRRFYIRDDTLLLPCGDNSSVIYFINREDIANGNDLTIKEYKAQFDDWKYAHPREVHLLKDIIG